MGGQYSIAWIEDFCLAIQAGFHIVKAQNWSWGQWL
jgi:hypothetical protein